MKHEITSTFIGTLKPDVFVDALICAAKVHNRNHPEKPLPEVWTYGVGDSNDVKPA